ncbi:TetR/AcrR family transcriptional regulator [Actinocorallia sp. API 0066]|uniref:TetR/AcrR family transcriptional regulator n=1 Tax=Actinocorallia sp. API 0066 TaxID=2896846 RepID=UPI001E413908|nr:TetR/AcrR family transcriptional regulator [Actinocorallia sp. API 0066]MCD0450488.1 TetR/AcrR family transcriptional regulator [Actinocorallia sp. API 0066]
MPGTSRGGRNKSADSREKILDVSERLMAAHGYAATPISAICRDAGLPPPSIYWHFGSKEGVLAAVMERGARRWFAGLPTWDDLTGPPQERVRALLDAGADGLAAHPAFLRLFYMLALDSAGDAVAAELVQRVRHRAIAHFRDAIGQMLAAAHPAAVAEPAAAELTRFAVAYSDGCFFALHLEPEQTDVKKMFADLGLALTQLTPIVVARIRAAPEPDR